MWQKIVKLLVNLIDWFLQRNSPEGKEERKKDDIERRYRNEQQEIERAAGPGVGDVNGITADILNRHEPDGVPGEGRLPGKKIQGEGD